MFYYKNHMIDGNIMDINVNIILILLSNSEVLE